MYIRIEPISNKNTRYAVISDYFLFKAAEKSRVLRESKIQDRVSGSDCAKASCCSIRIAVSRAQRSIIFQYIPKINDTTILYLQLEVMNLLKAQKSNDACLEFEMSLSLDGVAPALNNESTLTTNYLIEDENKMTCVEQTRDTESKEHQVQKTPEQRLPRVNKRQKWHHIPMVSKMSMTQIAVVG